MNAVTFAIRRRATTSDAGAIFDRVGARAWALAVWLVADERLAEEILVAAFTDPLLARRLRQGGAGLLLNVRERALAATSNAASILASSSVEHADGAETTREGAVEAAIKDLPEPQRGFVELALFGKLSVEELAAVSGTPRSVVTASLEAAMRILRPVLIREKTNGARREHAFQV